jgi:hypothetical protein
MRRNSPSEPPPLFEPENLEIETTDGRRPAGTAGDRMMLGLAAVALLGGALIAVTNALPDAASETSRATPVAHASGTPQPTASPPPPRSVQVVDEPLPSPGRELAQFEGWVRALEEVKIRSSSSSSAEVLAVLRPGDAAVVQALGPGDGARGWLAVVAPEQGWIRSRVDGHSVIRRYPYAFQLPPGLIDRLAAHANGFVGVGLLPTPDGEYAAQLFQSSDGARWNVGETPNMPPSDLQIAHGPAGWLLVTTSYDMYGTPTPFLWRAEDLTDWQLLGAIHGLPGEAFAQLVGSAAGYVAATGSGFGPSGGTIWYSRDGLAWSERRLPRSVEDGLQRLFATPLGFYVDSGSSAATAAFSPDGWTWSDVSVGGLDTLVGMAAAGDQLLAVDTASWGEVRAWTGIIRGSLLTWREEVSASTAFDGAAVTALVSDGQRPVAFGWELGTDAPLWWIRDGTEWDRQPLPPGFEGNPRAAAGGPAGTVVVGYRPSLVATNPVIWHLAADGTWAPEGEPVIQVQADPTPAQCGSTPADILDVMGRDPRWLAACFGTRPLTFRAWTSRCEGCYYEDPGEFEPRWLMQPTDNLLFLAPLANGDWGTAEAVLPPSLERDERWIEHWVEVTGHYDDAAATSCHLEPEVSERFWYDPIEVVNQCRARFVITSVTLVRGPHDAT